MQIIKLMDDPYDSLKDSDLKVEPSYDQYGRNDVTTTTIAGKAFVSDTVFDTIGRVYESYDPSGADHGLRYQYKSNGYLEKIIETKTNVNTVYRQITDMDNFGNVTREIFGNGVITEREYEETTGRLERINTTDGATSRQNLEYVWDNLGRLTSRKSVLKNKTDTYTYDNLNRVKNVNGINQVNYDAKGNITWKRGVGSYAYGGTCNGVEAGSHAVSSAGSASYCYDLNGNMLSGDGRTIDYAIFDKATSISKGDHTTEFAYSPSRNRYKRTDTNGSDITTTFYLGGVEYIQRPNGQTFYRRSIPGAVIEVPTTGAMKVNYLHVDHLGSTDVITNSSGATAQEYSFDFFGQKRNVTNWSSILTNTQFSPLDLTSRSYTGHESADEVGVIHMNGRIYDARIGRFMQADPEIDGATDSQGYNRYTYVRNNPLAYTDPTGFRRSGGLKHFGNFNRQSNYQFGSTFGTAGLIVMHAYNTNPNVQGVVSAAAVAVATYFCGACSAGVTAAVAAGTAAAGASNSVAVNGGNVVDSAKAGGKAYVTTYISAQVAGAIGDSFNVKTGSGLLGSSISHGTLGGVMSVLNGGKFGHGFASSFLSKFITTKLDLKGDISGKEVGNAFSRTMIAGMIGGTVSAATGGKFANGAAQSAIQWAFNAEGLSNLKKIFGIAEHNETYQGERTDALMDETDRVIDEVKTSIVNDIKSAKPSRATVHTVGTYTSLGLALGSLSPCSAICATSSAALDVALATDHFVHGETKDGFLTLVPGIGGAVVSKTTKTTILMSTSEAAQRGVGTTVLLNYTFPKNEIEND